MKPDLNKRDMVKKIVLIKTNLVSRDSRVLKERDTLKDAGYTIKHLCWNRGRYPQAEQSACEAGDEEECMRLRAPLGIRVVPLLPIWWLFALFHLLLEEWDIAQAINLDSAIPAVIAGRIKGKNVIYEIEDAYEDGVNLPRILRYVLVKIDRFFMRLSDAVIIVDESQIDEFGGIPSSRVVPIYDSPPDVSGEVQPISSDSGIFTLLYDGTLARERHLGLENVWEAIKQIKDTKLIITGFGNLVPEIQKWCLETPDKVTFLGWVSSGEIVGRSLGADLLLALRDAVSLNGRCNCGSKILKAMMCGKPSLVTRGTSSADKVAEANCGLAVDISNVQEIRQAIIRLKEDPELRRELGANGRRAYERSYNWDIMKQRLLDLYRELSAG